MNYLDEKIYKSSQAFAGSSENSTQDGLTKREYFAAMALQGLLANSALPTFVGYSGKTESVTDTALTCADMLLSKLFKNQCQNNNK